MARHCLPLLATKGVVCGLIGLLALAGCRGSRSGEVVTTHPAPLTGVPDSARTLALECLRRGIQYSYNPVVRVQAIEAYEVLPGDEGLPWVRSALLDEQAGVRFAACVVLGVRKDATVRETLVKFADDPNEDRSVRAAAVFALHQLGDNSRTGRLATYLLEDEDPAVRRNAALVLGRFEEEGTIKLLARAMRDPDEGVRTHALEAMARLGNVESKRQLRFMANSGVGSEELLALSALSDTRDPGTEDLLRYKLDSGMHVETRLAAARGLAWLGYPDGRLLALEMLDYNHPRKSEPMDKPADQVLRVRQLAILALGATGGPADVDALVHVINENNDPRLQVTAALAILEIDRKTIEQQPPWLTP